MGGEELLLGASAAVMAGSICFVLFCDILISRYIRFFSSSGYEQVCCSKLVRRPQVSVVVISLISREGQSSVS